jgi:hypothetical protein
MEWKTRNSETSGFGANSQEVALGEARNRTMLATS